MGIIFTDSARLYFALSSFVSARVTVVPMYSLLVKKISVFGREPETPVRNLSGTAKLRVRNYNRF